MKTNTQEDRFLTKHEEARLAAGLRKVLISEYPNPTREGCPDPKVLRALAFHKRIGDPETFERITNHMAKCSACVRDALGYAEEYKEHSRRRRSASMVLALVATLTLAMALWTIWRVQHQRPTVANSPSVPAQSSPTQTVAGKNTQTETSGLTPVAIELPLSWRGAAPRADRPIIIPRGHLQLEIRLPIGSPEGTYKLRISTASGGVRKTAESVTRSTNGILRLTVIWDTLDLPPGEFRLGMLEADANEWVDYTIMVQ